MRSLRHHQHLCRNTNCNFRLHPELPFHLTSPPQLVNRTRLRLNIEMTSICVHMLLFFLILCLWMESTSAEDEPTATEENCKPNCWSEAMDNIFRNDQCPKIDGCWGTVFTEACKNKWGTSLEACKKKCQQTMNCNAFNYLPNKLCVLLACPFPVPQPLGRKKGVKGYFITGSGDTWGRSRVPRVWSGIVQTKIWSKQQCSTNGVRRNVRKLEKCKKMCQEKSSCNAIHYNGFSCVFVKCPQHVPPPQGQNGKYKGYYILDPNDNYSWLQTKLSDAEAEWKESNTDSYGIDVDSKKVNGENECADWCGTTRGCYFWTLREKDNLCWLKTTIAGLYYHTVKRSGFTSGDKLCASEDALKTG